ncbi:MAG: hypothetical protein GC191_02535 [Azospirillum sp.]|nr:hypothetical protein [Azospirillum sp.]
MPGFPPRAIAAFCFVLGLAPVLAGSALAAPPPPAVPSDTAVQTKVLAPPSETFLPISAEAAGRLAEAIDSELRRWFPATGEGLAYRWDGKVTAVAIEDHYEVVLPALTLIGEDHSALAVGVVKLAVSPSADGRFGVAATVPAKIPLLSAEGKPEGELTVGEQKLTGTWVPALETLVKADMALRDIRASSVRDGSGLRLGAVTVKTDLSELRPGRWSGPSTLGVNELSVTDEHGVELGHVGRAGLDAAIVDMDLAHAANIDEQLEAQPKGIPAAAVKKRLAMLHGLFAGASGRLEIHDFALATPSEGSRFAFSGIAIDLSLDGLDQATSTLSLGYDHTGLKIEPAVTPAQFMPERIALKIAAANLPNGGLWDAFANVFDAPAAGEKPVVDSEQLGQQVLGELSRSKAEIRVGLLQIDTPATAARLVGTSRFNAGAVFGMEADFNLVLRGLEIAIKSIQPPTGQAVDPETQNSLAMLGMVQAMGLPGKDDQGRDTRNYKIGLSADGKVGLNGADLTALLGGGAPPAAGKHGK